MDLSVEEMHSLRAAEGWAELGDCSSALEELDKVRTANRSHPLVLQVRSEVYFLSKRWDALIDISNVRIQASPNDDSGWINCAYALHELNRTREALKILLPVADKFATNWCVPYNLACYTCQLGDRIAAIQWLKRAVEVAGDRDVRVRALTDPDLEPMRVDILEI